MAYWKKIVDFPEYEINTLGQVWSWKKGKFLKPSITHGYHHVILCDNNKKYTRYVHRLLLEVFLGPCPKGMEACHNNGNKSDNRLENLRWGTHSENTLDSVKHGTHPTNKLTEQDVRIIIYMYRTGEFIQQEIANIYKIHQVHVSGIVLKKRWKHIWRRG